ncbi:MAG: Xaa-Pro peptidase family protein [Eubacteriales bacterium]|jgi:Xaa-Pro aminopeptidase|nr:Xaa-Pro peptidase family protein [Eubacteriales bacterium]
MVISKIQKELKHRELDAVLVSSYENRRYSCGFTGSDGFALITLDNAYLYVDGRYKTQAGLETKGIEIIEYKSKSYEILQKHYLENLAIEDKKLSYFDYKRLKEALPNAQIHSGSDIFENLRIIKNADEIENIKKAAEIADLAFGHILDFIEVGMTEKEIALELEHFMLQNGAQGVSFSTIVACSERSALPHAQPTDTKVQRGDMLLMDFGCRYNGYCSDITRTVAVGSATEKQIRIYDIVLSAQKSALEKIKGGASTLEVDGAARELIKDAGFGDKFIHSLGHGVGLDIHELPTVSSLKEKILKPGFCITVEPGIYLEGEFGVRIEDLVVVTEDGYINLVSSPKELIVI